ncbi:MAG TPA: type II toxin-antitoxin system VapC family toxin [Rectinemataceae bacterium]|nr:type II toxin-antitoxin system VapC family toxin [Rectinemataceae bacterium]
MGGYLIDSSVILDIFTDDPRWGLPSLEALDRAAAEGTIAINPIIYSEISIRFSKIEELERAVRDAGFLLLPLPREALFLAGKAFFAYRRGGGSKTSPLPDFFIGAHAAVSGLALLTRDPERIRRHFPRVTLVVPGSEKV